MDLLWNRNKNILHMSGRRLLILERYLLPKINNRISDILENYCSSCGILSEKVSEFLENQLAFVMQNGKSYIRNSLNFLEKMKKLNALPENAMLVPKHAPSGRSKCSQRSPR